MLLLILFAFLAGIVTILSPCILPVLPIVLSSSMTGGKRRPFGVITGFVLSFTFFSLGLTALVKATGIDPNILRAVAIFIILVFGVSLLIPQARLLLEKLTAKLANLTPNENGESSGFGGGIVVGLSLGLVWTPCAGPILASVITLAATSSVTLQAVFITLAYTLGTSIPMLAIIFGGRTLLQKVPFLLRNSGKIQKIFGLIIILVAVGMYFNLDRKLQQYILDKFPSYGEGITKLEELDSVTKELDKLNMLDEEETGRPIKMPGMKDAVEVLSCNENPLARGFEEGGEWLNSLPLKLEELRGKVVLVDFWTYTCINCIRTLPYINGWHEKYADDGLVIVGVHTPEFEFEKEKENVEEAIKDFDIQYPVVQDNEYKIWRAYNNRYWPAKYFIDKNGCIRDKHFGEGDYEESEKIIQELLAETGAELDGSVLDIEEYQGEQRTPETYLGYGRIERFASLTLDRDKLSEYLLPVELMLNEFAFGGKWEIGEERSKSGEDAVLELKFKAKQVHLVMRSEKEAEVKVFLDGKLIEDSVAGKDVENGTVKVMKDMLYNLVELKGNGEHLLELKFEPGVEVYAFTFG